MKSRLVIILIIAIFISSCSTKVLNRFYNLKPSKFYYTTKLKKDIIFNDEIKMNSIETNFYKRFTLDSDNRGEIIRFISLLKDEHFLEIYEIKEKSDIEDKKSQFKINIDINKNKYCIEVIDESYIKIFLWDGKYVEDYIKIEDLPMGENLFYYLKYIYLTKKI